MIELPIDGHLPDIVMRLREGGSLVLVAAPGAGKTTRVGPAILRGGILGKDNGRVLMLEPRRVAARAAAERIAFEQGWRVGEEVGYQVRFEKRYSDRTRLVVLTEAILTRRLLSDPYLDGVGCVILDEFHERSLHTDLALAFLREVQQTVRPELKIVVMSATLEAEPVAAFLGGAPVVKVEGRSWPVEVLYRSGRDVRLEVQVKRVVEEGLSGEGDVLVFLPGLGEIERVRRELSGMEGAGLAGLAVLPLHGSLTSEEQQRALAPDGRGRRKVILATNIAETSLTIDGVRCVVDSGLARVASFDADRGMDRLDLERISQASATQRAGRAGRQGPGRAFRLWAELEHKHMPAFSGPEIQRVDLAQAVLAVHAWGASDARAFGWFEKPAEEKLRAAERLLEMLGGVEETRNMNGETRNGGEARAGFVLTEDGRRMLELPVHPRIGRLLLAAAGTELLGEAVDVAARLSEDSRGGKESGNLERVREQLRNLARGLSPSKDGRRATQVGELLLLAFPDRVAKRRGADAFAAVMVGAVGLRLAAEALTPAVAASELFLAVETHHDPRNQRAQTMVRTAVPVEAAWLERLFPGQMRTEMAMEFDASKTKVVAVTRRYFGDLVLAEDLHGRVDGQRAGAVLAKALAGRARELFLADEGAAEFLARLGLVRHCVPAGVGGVKWPAFGEEDLRELLAQACQGRKSLAEVLDGGRLLEVLREAVVYPLDRELEKLAPETLEVPSGSKIRLEYAMGRGNGDAIAGFLQDAPAPVLAVRLQELFGWRETPRICGGRVAVVLHLLSPGFKPMQITSDLASFWKSAYYEVRKDLRARYPKHKWPEDPLSAAPEAKGRGRRT